MRVKTTRRFACFYAAVGFIVGSACTPHRLEFDQGQTVVHAGALPKKIASLSADECAACHPADHKDWQESVHGRAYTNELFQDSLDIEPAVWCVNCHAPLAEQALPPVKGQIRIADRNPVENPKIKALRAEGINCAACHIRDGKIYTNHSEGAAKGEPYHPMKYDPYLGSAGFCRGCHQFNFPYFAADKVVEYGPSPMQNTYNEWRASPVSWIGISCNDCHGSRANHKVYGPHTPGWLEKKISLEAFRTDDCVTAILTLRGIPHSFPTGDLFRGFDLKVTASGERVGVVSFGRKTADFKDAGAPDGIYKKYYQEKVLYPDFRGSIEEKIQIQLTRKLKPNERASLTMVYYFRNKEAERTLPAHIAEKELVFIPDIPVRKAKASRQ